MKKLVFLLLLLPVLSFAQVSNWRGGGNMRSAPSMSPRSFSYSSPNNNISSWRNTPTQPPRQGQYFGSPYLYDPFWDWGWGWNRWNMWGAPLGGWNYWQPFPYFDNWGYRQPGRIYVYEDGKRDTIRGVKPNIGLGVQTSSNGEFGFWGSIGNKTYFITEYNQTIVKDNSVFFPNGQLQDADFPIYGNVERLKSFYLGLGKRFNRTGVHLMVGRFYRDVRYKGRDDIGFITFPNYKEQYMALKVGAKHDLKNFSFKADVDPIVGRFTVGTGFNF